MKRWVQLDNDIMVFLGGLGLLFFPLDEFLLRLLFFLFLISFHLLFLVKKNKSIRVSLPTMMLCSFTVYSILVGANRGILNMHQFWNDVLLWGQGGYLLFLLDQFSEGKRRSLRNPLILMVILITMIYLARGFFQFFYSFEHLERALSQITQYQEPLLQHHFINAVHSRRIISFFGDPNLFGHFLLISLILCWELPYRKMLLIVLFILAGLVMTMSRTCWVAFFLILLIDLIVQFKAGKKGLIVKRTFLFPVIFLIIWLSVSFFTRSGKTSDSIKLTGASNLSTMEQRFGYWDNGFQQFCRHPYGGNGAGTYGLLYSRYKAPDIQETRYAHNLIIQLLAEYGVLGTLFFLLFLLYPFFKLCVKRPVDLRLLMLDLTFLLVNMMSFSSFEYRIFLLYLSCRAIYGKEDALIFGPRILSYVAVVPAIACTFIQYHLYQGKMCQKTIKSCQRIAPDLERIYWEKWNALWIKDPLQFGEITDLPIEDKEKIRLLRSNSDLLAYSPFGNFMLSYYCFKENHRTEALSYGYQAHLMYPLKEVYIVHLLRIFRVYRPYRVMHGLENRKKMAEKNFY